MDVSSIIESVVRRWFYIEPVLFPIYCTHRLVENKAMKCGFRVGKMQLQYNPVILAERIRGKPEAEAVSYIEGLMKMEVIRVLLKHPYDRQPNPVNPIAASLASDITVLEAERQTPFHSVFELKEGLTFEEYYDELDNQTDGQSQEQLEEKLSKEIKGNPEIKELLESARDKTELWEENQIMSQKMNQIINNATSWGSLSGDAIAMIKATAKPKVDYREVLRNFRSSVLSDERNLTRMRPSRRYGYQCMGSKYQFSTKLLVGVDTSGSISDKALTNFFGVINALFQYGIKAIDVVEFDVDIQDEPIPLKKARDEFKVSGRGGTDIGPLWKYAASKAGYDGLIVFTDGYFQEPEVKLPMEVVWVFETKSSYEHAVTNGKLEKLGRMCYIDERN